MQEQVDNIEKDLKEVKAALLGNEYNPNGFVKRIEKVENYQSRDKKTKWTLAGVGLAIGFILKYFT